jgi:Zn-dependent protease with chaperone function
VPWCERCGWNLRVDEAAPTDLFNKLTARYAARRAPGLRDRMMALGVDTEPRRGRVVFASYLLATVMYLPFAILSGLGLWLLIGQWPDPFPTMLGFIFIVGGLTLIPHFARLPDAGLLRPPTAPHLFALLDSLCDGAGGRRIETVVVDTTYNAWSARCGWRQKRAIGIGLPLAAVLEPQELVAVLAHEVGHSVNGDALRGAYIGNALDISVGLIVMFRTTYKRGLTHVYRLVSVVPWLVTVGLVNLQFASSQEAEYRADSVATKAAGSSGMIGLLRKLRLRHSYETASVRAGGNLDTLIVELQKRIREAPAREVERQLRLQELPGARLDGTHPPAGWRIDFAVARYREPAVTLDDTALTRILGELRAVEPATPLAYRHRKWRGL